MKEESSIINSQAGDILKQAIKDYDKTQISLAHTLKISTKQLQNYAKGIFPKFKSDNVKALDEILGTSVYEMVYKKEPKSEIKVPRETVFLKPTEESRERLERTLENLSEDKIRSTAIIERLVTLLEKQFGYDPAHAKPGDPGTVPVKENRPKAVD